MGTYHFLEAGTNNPPALKAYAVSVLPPALWEEKTKKSYIKWAAPVLAAATVLLSACASLSSLVKEPAVSLESVTITGVDFKGVDLLCTIQVQNPNSISIPFPEIDWKLFVSSDTSFVSGVIPSNKTLGAKESTTIPLPVHVDYKGLYDTVTSIAAGVKNGTKETNYKIDLMIKFSLPVLGEIAIPKEFSGAVPLVQMPKFSKAAVSISKLDFEGFEMLCTFDVENPNIFDIPFPKLNSDYSISSASLIKTDIETPPILAANASSPITIRGGLKFADVFSAVPSLGNVTETAGAMAIAVGALAIPAFADSETPPIEAAHTIVIPKLPAIQFKDFEVLNVSLTKVDCKFSFEVENKNSFASTLDSFTYTFTVGDSRWLTGKAPRIIVGPRQKATIPLNLSIDAVSLVRDIAGMALNHTTKPFAFEGNTKITSNYPGLGAVNLPISLTGSKKF
jgi:LEA14-like dessication related protein